MNKTIFFAFSTGVLLFFGFIEFISVLSISLASGIVKCLFKHELMIKNIYISRKVETSLRENNFD